MMDNARVQRIELQLPGLSRDLVTQGTFGTVADRDILTSAVHQAVPDATLEDIREALVSFHAEMMEKATGKLAGSYRLWARQMVGSTPAWREEGGETEPGVSSSRLNRSTSARVGQSPATAARSRRGGLVRLLFRHIIPTKKASDDHRLDNRTSRAG
jgi:hypothetical protein